MGAELAAPSGGGTTADPAAGLSALVHALREAGYRAGPAELVSAGRLLTVLARRNPLPTTAAELAPWLRPVFCSTREEQARFDEIFGAWLEALEQRGAAERAAADPAAGAAGSGDAAAAAHGGDHRKPWAERAAQALRALVVIAAIGVGAWVVWKQAWQPSVGTAPPAAGVGTEPAAGAASAAGAAPVQPIASPATQPDLQGIYPAVREMRSLRPEIVWPLLALPLLLLLVSGGVPALALMQGRHRSGREVVLDTTALAREAEQVLPGLDPSVAARLERHVRAEGGSDAPLARRRRLDARRTVEATLRRHGVISPQYRAVPLRPSYLMLIDAEDEHDPRGRVFYLWAERMRRQGLMVDIRLFRHPAPESPAAALPGTAAAVQAVQAVQPVQVARAPRCWRIGEAALLAPDRDTGVALDRLEDPPAGQRLVVISEAASWLQPDGRWRDWFVRARLRRWPQRVFFTPNELRDWGLPEERLETQEHAADPGFLVLPLDEAALGAWSTLLAAGSLPAFTLAEAQRYPRVLAAAGFDPFAEPPQEVLDRLVAQLKIYLRDSGFRWLAALAVPPMCRWELTLLLGQTLFDHRISRLAAASGSAAGASADTGADTKAATSADPLDARTTDTGEPWRVILGRSYRRLARLPWLRGGRDAAGRVHAAGLPDWLRLRLLHELPPSAQEEIREIVGRLLSTLRPDVGSGLALDFEAPPQTRQDAERAEAGKPPDRLYLGYLSGLTPRQLALRLPGSWREWLRNEPPPEPGWRAKLFHALRRLTDRLQATWARMRYEDGMPWAQAFALPIAAVVMLVGAGFVSWRLAEQPADRLAGGVESLLFERALRPVLPADAKDWQTLALSPDGRLAIDQSRALQGLRVWDTTTGRVVRRLPDLGVDAAIFDGPERFSTCGLLGIVKHWQVRDASPNAGGEDGRVDEALSRRSLRGDEAGTCTLGRGAAVWADINGKAVEIRSKQSTAMQMRQLTDRQSESLVVSPNGRWLLSKRAGSAPDETTHQIADLADLSTPPAVPVDLKIDGPMAWAGDTLGTLRASGDSDTSLTLRDIARGGFFELPLDGLRHPTSLALSADARYALVGTASGEIALWDVERRRELMRRVAGSGAVDQLWMSEDGATVVSSAFYNRPALWHAWQPLLDRTALPAVAVAVSADGRRAAFAAGDGQIEITDAAQPPSSAIPAGKLQGPPRPTLLAFSADGQRFAAAGDGSGVTIWPTLPGRSNDAAGVSATTDAPLVHLAYTGDGQRLLGVSRIGSIYEWRAADGRPIGVAPDPAGRTVAAVAMRGDGLLAISATAATAATAETADGSQPVVVRTREAVQTQHNAPSSWREIKLRFLADGQRLAMSERVASGEWDLRTGVYTVHAEAPATRSTGMEALRDDAIDGSGQWRAAVSQRGALQVWKLRGGEEAKLPEVAGPVEHARWTNAGTLVVASTSGAVSVWDPATARATAIPVNLGAAPAQIALSADGSRLAATPLREAIVPPPAESNAATNGAPANDVSASAAQQQVQQQVQQSNPPRKSNRLPIEKNAPTKTNAPLPTVSPTVSPAAPAASSPAAAAPAGPLPQAGWWALFADELPPAPRRLLDERLQWPAASALLLSLVLLPLLVMWRERRHSQRLRQRLQPPKPAASAAIPQPAAAAATAG